MSGEADFNPVVSKDVIEADEKNYTGNQNTQDREEIGSLQKEVSVQNLFRRFANWKNRKLPSTVTQIENRKEPVVDESQVIVPEKDLQIEVITEIPTWDKLDKKEDDSTPFHKPKGKNYTPAEKNELDKEILMARGHVPITPRNWDAMHASLGFGVQPAYPFSFEESSIRQAKQEKYDAWRNFWKNKTILDIGTGKKEYHDFNNTFPGAYLCALDPAINSEELPGGEITITNPDWYASEAQPGIATDLPYEDDQFDIVWSSRLVSEHLSSPQQSRALLEMFRVMRPNGEIRMTPPMRFSSPQIGTLVRLGIHVEEFSVAGGTVTRIRLDADNQKNKEVLYQELVKEYI